MHTIMLDNQSLSSVKSSIELKRNILLLNRKTYFKRLKELEKKHGLTTASFLKKFSSGEIGDKPDWFDWDFIHRAFTRINQELEILKKTGI